MSTELNDRDLAVTSRSESSSMVSEGRERAPEQEPMIREGSEQTSSRRGILSRGGVMVAGFAAGTLAMSRRAMAQSSGPTEVLVNIELAGGADGLTLCAPYADSGYQTARGALAVPAPSGSNGVLNLDGYFGLPPGMAALHPIYQANDMAIIHGSGRTVKNQSHFDAQHQFQTGNPTGMAIPDQNGIYARYLNHFYPQPPACAGSTRRRSCTAGWWGG